MEPPRTLSRDRKLNNESIHNYHKQIRDLLSAKFDDVLNENTRIDTTVFYGGEYIDYHIDEQLSFLSEGAFMEYEGTKLSSCEILVNWETFNFFLFFFLF